MPVDAFTSVLIKHLTREQLHQILEAVSAELGMSGECPLCGMEDVPVTKSGREIEGEDVSMAWEWRERHDEDCPVTLIEKSFTRKARSTSRK